MTKSPNNNHIGTLNEKPLHAALKSWYAQPGDQLETLVDGYVIDIVRGDLLIEVQTKQFSQIKKKLYKLATSNPVRLVFPVAKEKWLLKLASEKKGPVQRRKSPKRGSYEDVFHELVSFPELMLDRNFTLEVVLIQEEEVRRYDEKRAWRRKGWVTVERRLLEVLDQRRFVTPADLGALLPDSLHSQFTTYELAAALGRPRRIAQKMAYCLRRMNVISQVGKRGRSLLYSRTDPA